MTPEEEQALLISGQQSSAEPLSPVELTTDAAAAAATAGEALLQVKAQEVATLAEVLTRLNEKESSLEALANRLETSVTAIETMKLEIQATLAAIQATKEAAETPTVSHQTAPKQVKGLGNLLMRR